jgi:phosphohistidine phosphatase
MLPGIDYATWNRPLVIVVEILLSYPRILLVMRHAEALSASPDRERPLTEHGRNQSQTMGERLIRESLTPDFILHSSILRAQETASALSHGADLPESILHGCGEDFYRAEYPEHILKVVQETIPEESQIALIVGHNPTIHQFAAMMASHAPNAVSDRLGVAYPPATISVFRIESQDWRSLRPAHAEMTDLLLAP